MSTGPTPEQLRDRNRRDLARLEDEVGDLRKRLSFTDALESLTDARGRLPELAEGLSRLRSRGYLFRRELEGRLAEAQAQADGLVEQARQETGRAGRDLRDDVDRFDAEVRQLRNLDLIAIGPLVDKQQAAGRRVAEALAEVERRVEAIGEPLTSRVREVGQAVKDLSWTLDQFEASTAKLLPEENPVACAMVTWTDAPEGKLPGRLLLTDHRVRFEHVEEKVTKRKLFFFAAEKEEVRELELDEPVGHLASSEDKTSGLIVKDQLLVLTWDRKAKAPPTTTFELESGKAKDWDDVVERLIAGDLERDMLASGPSADTHGVPVEWPDKCSECGANLDDPVKGQTTIDCAYCGATHDVVMGQG